MQIWGISTVRNEADIIELTVRHIISEGIDYLIIADNLSHDGTREILEGLAQELPITVVDDLDPAHRQSEKMTALAEQAVAGGADWIVPIDADEIWRSRNGTVRDAIEGTSSNIIVAPVFDHHPRPTMRGGSIIERMPWNRTTQYAKVAYRWHPGAVITDGNHWVKSLPREPDRERLLIDHYPFRSWPQFRRKMRQGAAALALTDLPHKTGSVWREIGTKSDWRIRLSWWNRRLHPKLRRRDRAAWP